MKNSQSFLSENFPFLEVKFSIHLKRRVFAMHVNESHEMSSLIFSERLQIDFRMPIATYFLIILKVKSLVVFNPFIPTVQYKYLCKQCRCR